MQLNIEMAKGVNKWQIILSFYIQIDQILMNQQRNLIGIVFHSF